MVALIIFIALAITLIPATVWVLKLRRIVPTNVVHIVQRGTKTVSYGVGQDAGNSYYEFPIWMPKFGVETRVLPVSNFDISLEAYPAYDVDRVPFHVDIKAFFHIKDTNTAAAKVRDTGELEEQLTDIVRGVVRSILAKSNLEEIMGERPKYAKQFTEAVENDLKSWGVESVKSIELMDVRDEPGSKVIHNIMEKKKSSIEKESRIAVALNHQEAEQAELDAVKEVQVRKAETERMAGEARADSNKAVGIANANANKASGIANQQAESGVAEAAKETALKHMAVTEVNQIRQKEIDKKAAIIQAELEQEQIKIDANADKYKVETEADAGKYNVEAAAKAKLEADKLQATGEKAIGLAAADVVLADGKSRAESKKLEQLASVTAEVTLAEKVGKNQEYQNFLIRKQEVAVTEVVGVAEADAKGRALESADLKVLVNSGNVETGMNSFLDILSSKGGSQMNGALEALEQTPLGGKLVSFLKTLPDVPKKK